MGEGEATSAGAGDSENEKGKGERKREMEYGEKKKCARARTIGDTEDPLFRVHVRTRAHVCSVDVATRTHGVNTLVILG